MLSSVNPIHPADRQDLSTRAEPSAFKMIHKGSNSIFLVDLETRSAYEIGGVTARLKHGLLPVFGPTGVMGRLFPVGTFPETPVGDDGRRPGADIEARQKKQ